MQPNEKPLLKPHQIAILIAAVLSVVALAVPILATVFVPLELLNTHIHELAHAVAGQITGADIDFIQVNADGSGATPMTGGSIWLVGPAGYVGAAIVGAMVIWYSRTEKGARNTLRVLSIAMLIGMLLWVRGDLVGILSGLAWIAALLAASQYLKGMSLLFAAQFVGLQQCLNSIQAVYVLLHISAVSDAHNDARIMQEYTAIPAAAWAFGWCAFSLVLVVISLRRAWSLPTSPSGRPLAGR